MTKVSVIIATYNRAHFIKEAIESVLAQTYDDFEIIVVDDGSTDNTRDVVTAYGDKVRYFLIEHGNQAIAMNYGIARATGEYIAFLDDDDLWLQDKLQTQVCALDRDPQVGLVGSEVLQVNAKGDVIFHWGRKYHDPLTYEDLYNYNFMNHSITMIRKSLADRVGGFDEKLLTTQDYDLWLRIAKISKIVYINQPLGKIRLHPNNKHKNRNQKIKDRLYIITKPEHVTHRGFYERRLRIAKEYYQHADYFKNVASYRSAAVYYFKSILYYPAIGNHVTPDNPGKWHKFFAYRLLRPYLQVVYWSLKGLTISEGAVL